MANNNITEFILLGLTQDPRRQKIIFVIFFVFYVGKLVGNLLIFVTIKFSWTLGSPMYFFIFHLSVSDTCFSTSIAPRLIVDALASKKKNKNKNISYNECMTQVFALHIHGCMEIFVLILMAVDHYVAICKPLHYPTIMRHQACILLIVFAWIGSFIHSMAQIILALRLPSCGPNLIDHYCCELQPCWNLPACTLMQSACCWCLTVGPYAQAALWFWWSHTLLSCIPWETTVQKERKKVLSTFTSHIIVLILFFGPCIFIYTCPPTTFPMDKMVAVFYTIGTPFLNLLICTLRNAEVKYAMRRLWYVKITLESKRWIEGFLWLLIEWWFDWLKRSNMNVYNVIYSCTAITHKTVLLFSVLLPT